ncbi:hypothetical protein [Paraburkholderia kururiensis]|uniref:Peptidase C39-like domain-containing protein n=1 Tax=Paraburkholderia kururiensis TaxID=984307 RepID=A0ABZ0WV19_9BURK|nr:hypothetical protein [Paraburkholderia kururiensis]WQD81269.1 hypothetical protein U0042_29800 [Paraburkholderia kururiensis]
MTSDDMRQLRWVHARFCELYPFLATKEGAEGLCRWASLTFADMAAHCGIELNIIKWRVLPDSQSTGSNYTEHWAVDLGGGRVLDPTSAQVDGLPSAWVCVLDYPPNYMSRQSVPARALLPTYRNHMYASTRQQLSDAVMQELNHAFNANIPRQPTNPLRYIAAGVAVVATGWTWLHFLLTH